MHENELSRLIIGAAIEVHREVGPGLIEKPYEEAMCHELHLRGLGFTRQWQVPFVYKGVTLSADLRTDLVVEGKVVVDLKAKEQVTAIDKLKVLTYLRLLDLRLGLVINFHVTVLKDGVHRVVNNLIDPETPPELPDLHARSSLRPPRLCVSALKIEPFPNSHAFRHYCLPRPASERRPVRVLEWARRGLRAGGGSGL